MKFSTSRKLLIEDFPEEQRAWLNSLLQPLNSFMEKVSDNLSGGLTIADNGRAIVKAVEVVANQTYPSKLNVQALKQKPVSVTIGSLRIKDGTTPSASYSVYWTYDEGTLSYTFLGLDSSKAYSITLIIQT
jgi:hypothetical protein